MTDYFINKYGAKIYLDELKQPLLEIPEGQTQLYVYSVGFNFAGTPLITIRNNRHFVCYKLPLQYCEWVKSCVGLSRMGLNCFPAQCVFTRSADLYQVDIL